MGGNAATYLAEGLFSGNREALSVCGNVAGGKRRRLGTWAQCASDCKAYRRPAHPQSQCCRADRYVVFADRRCGPSDAEQGTIARRQKAADFREICSVNNSTSLSILPTIARIYELASCHLIRPQRDAVLVAPLGGGQKPSLKPSESKPSRPVPSSYRSMLEQVRERFFAGSQARGPPAAKIPQA